MATFESQFQVGDQPYIFTNVGTCVQTTIDSIKFTPGTTFDPFNPDAGFIYVTSTTDGEGGFLERVQALTFADKDAAKAYIDSIGV